MPESGLFITLFNGDTLRLYLDRGVYGFHMTPDLKPGPRSRHYAAFADYACARENAHVFFFRKRHIVYGGQIVGSSKYGAFYINGPYSPVGKKAEAKLVWDESKRKRYLATGKPGIFKRPSIGQGSENPVCQPYLLMFQDKLGLKARSILSDKLYFELGKFPYPLPTNSISGMSFCTMTPAEVTAAIELLESDPDETFSTQTDEAVSLLDKPMPFRAGYGISKLAEAMTESQLEAYCLANRELLPKGLRPVQGATLCRQVPVSPFKPTQMDRADICYYLDEAIKAGSVPNVVIELKNHSFGSAAETEQVAWYVKWLRKIAERESRDIRVCLLAPCYSDGWERKIAQECLNQIEPFTFEGKYS